MGGRSGKSFFNFFLWSRVPRKVPGKFFRSADILENEQNHQKSKITHQISTFLKMDSKKINLKTEFSKSPRAYFEASHKLPRNQKSRQSGSICDFQPMTGERFEVCTVSGGSLMGNDGFLCILASRRREIRYAHLSWVGSRKSSLID